MKTEYTPSPWVISEGKAHDVVMMGYGSLIAHCDWEPLSMIEPTEGGITFDQAIANARLITAAPELLEALEALVNFENVDPADGNQPTMGVWADAMKAAQKAIDKAKGENR